MIMLFIPWWTYVLLGTVAFVCAFLGVWLAHLSGFGAREGDDEPFPCFAHMQVDEYGNERWCWLPQGHDDDHVSQLGLDDNTAFTEEWPEDPVRVHRIEWPVPSWLNEESVSFTTMDGVTTTFEADGTITDLPPLPQRLSRVPVQTGHNDPWPTCDHGLCELPRAHQGPHSHY